MKKFQQSQQKTVVAKCIHILTSLQLSNIITCVFYGPVKQLEIKK